MGDTEIVETCIDGLFRVPLGVIGDQRGAVMHLIRSDSAYFVGFGEVYISMVAPHAVKAWRRHHSSAQSLSVSRGSVEFVFYDDRPDSPSRGEVTRMPLSLENYSMVRIPPMLWYSFRSVTKDESLIVNCCSKPHNPNDIDRLEDGAPTIPFKW